MVRQVNLPSYVGFSAFQAALPTKSPLSSLTGEADAGLVGVVLVGHVGAEGAVTLLQAEAVEGGRVRR